MQFYSVYDLLVHHATEKNITTEEMISYLQKKGVRKYQILEMQQTAYYPMHPKILTPILEFTGRSKLELDLLLGRIPAEYRKSYFANIDKIAAVLEPDKTEQKIEKKIDPYFCSELGTLYHANCLNLLPQLKDNSVDLIFADPPFNLGKEYDEGIMDNLTPSDYLNWCFSWIDECIRILKPGGYLFIYNIPRWCTYMAGHLDHYLTFWYWIAIDMKYRLPISGRLYPAHYSLLAYVKGPKPAIFHNRRIPIQTCRHCGGEIKDYGGYKSKMNPLGVNLSDVWSDIYPVRHKRIKNRKFNELPIKLLDRVISLATEEGSIVFDPFGGSGTTYAVAELLHRRWIGCELGDCDIIIDRLKHPENDQKQMKKIYKDNGQLFTKEAKRLREKNGFWTS